MIKKDKKIAKLEKYLLSVSDQSILSNEYIDFNDKYVDFTSENKDLLRFLRFKPCLQGDIKYTIREFNIWSVFQDNFCGELLKIATNWNNKDIRDYNFYNQHTDYQAPDISAYTQNDPLESYIYALGDAVTRFDVNFIKKTFQDEDALKHFIDRMIEQEFLISKQWHSSANEKKQQKFIKTVLEDLLLSLPLESAYFDTYSKNFSNLTYKIHINNKDALIKHINFKEISVKDLKRMPLKIINLKTVMNNIYSNIIKQKNKKLYKDRMLSFFLLTKKNKFWDVETIKPIFNLIKIHKASFHDRKWKSFLKYTPHLKDLSPKNSSDTKFQKAYMKHFVWTLACISDLPNEIFNKYFNEDFWSMINPKAMSSADAGRLLDSTISRGSNIDILQLALLKSYTKK